MSCRVFHRTNILYLPLFFIALASLPAICNGQSQSLLFQTGTSSNEGATGVVTDSSGNIYVTGLTFGDLNGPNQGSADAFLTKYNAAGTELWKKQIGTGALDSGQSVTIDNSGNVYLTGRTFGNLSSNNIGSSDAFITKYDSSGNEAWSKQLGTNVNDQAFGVAVDGSGNTYITGSTTGHLAATNAGQDDAFLVKLNPAGDQIWSRQLGSSLNDVAFSIALNSAGDAFITGSTAGNLSGSPHGGGDALLTKFASNGIHQWTNQLGTSSADFSGDVAIDANGNAYITGYSAGSFGGTNAGGNDIILVKVSGDGVQQWATQLGTAQNDQAHSVALDANGEIVIVGQTAGDFSGTNAGGDDAFISRLDANGVELWREQFGSAGIDRALAVSLNADGSAVIVGFTTGDVDGTNSGAGDIFVTRYTTAVPEFGIFGFCSSLAVVAALFFRRSRIIPTTK